MLHRGWFPDSITGERIVLRRHVPENLAAFRRWYADPEVARLTRYQEGPMPIAEIDRFFQARVVGPDSLALAIHLRDYGPAHRDLRVQPARRRQRLGALPHHDRREGRLGPRLRHRGDRADARARLRATRPPPGGAVRVRVQRARDPGLPEGRLRRRGSRPPVDLARRALLGRAPDEHARLGLGGPPAGRRPGRPGRVVQPATSRSRSARLERRA